MFRMCFKAWAGHYGFYLLVPGLIVYYTFFLKILPGFLKPGVIRIFFLACFMFLSALLIISHFDVSKFAYQHRTVKISSDRGSIYVFDNDRDYKCKALLEFLDKNTNEKETVVIFPEGVFINFLVKRENPLYFYHYLPYDLNMLSIENKIIDDMKDKKIDYIVINQRDASEYGSTAFGYHYGRKIFQYILDNYILYRQLGPFPFTSEYYGIAVFKRKT